MNITILITPVTSNDHIKGNLKASITLVEYGDYECPYCGLAHSITQRLLENFKKHIRLVYRHFPLIDLHPYAELAAEVAEFAGAHGHFWEMHDLIYKNQRHLNRDTLIKLVRELNLSEVDLLNALKNKTYLPKIQKDVISGESNRVQGTPTFFINNQHYNGNSSDLESFIEQILKQ